MSDVNDVGVQATQNPAAAEPSTPPATPWWQRAIGGVHGILALLLIVLAAGLAGFAVGGYGFDLVTLRLMGVFLLVFLVVNYTAGLLKWAISRRRSRRVRLVVRPIHLAVLLVVVIFTQLIGAQPVLIFGLLLAVDHAALTNAEADADVVRRDTRLVGIAVLAGAVWVLLLGIAGAVAHEFVAAHPFADLVRWDEIDVARVQELATAMDLATILALELSLAVVITTIGSLPVLLLPLRGFEGRLLWEWSRVAWTLAYLVALGSAGLLLAPSLTEAAWWLWAAPFIGYAMIVLAFALTNRRTTVTT